MPAAVINTEPLYSPFLLRVSLEAHGLLLDVVGGSKHYFLDRNALGR